MTDKDIWNGLNHIDDELVEEAAEAGRNRKRFPVPKLAAACFCLIVGLAAWQVFSPGNGDMTQMVIAESAADETEDAETAVAEAAEEAVGGAAVPGAAEDAAAPAAEESDSAQEAAKATPPEEEELPIEEIMGDYQAPEILSEGVGIASVEELGEDYHAAEDYGEVYRSVKKWYEAWYNDLAVPEAEAEDTGEITDGAPAGAAMAPGELPELADLEDVPAPLVEADDAEMGAATSAAAGAAAAGEDAGTPEAAEPAQAGGGDYSKTNVMTEGVDEADIVKTDGSYIYSIKGSSVVITDIREVVPGRRVVCRLPQEHTLDQVEELFVDGSSMVVIASYTEEEDGFLTWEEMSSPAAGAWPWYYENSYNRKTAAYVYDISEPQSPKYRGVLEADGNYKTARKTGDQIYLFTNLTVRIPDVKEEEAVSEEILNAWIPTVNGSALAANCIYLTEAPEYGADADGMLIASADIHDPGTVTDAKYLLTGDTDTYVGSSHIFLYYYSWDDEKGGDSTRMISLSYDEGKIEGRAHTRVRGQITDSFAISEGSGMLRVLTTDYSGSHDRNTLYILNEDLKQVGLLEDIAPGEDIYAARYLGNIVYFVTYRNTDPLFAVDLSDPENPKLLGELQITGYSEYLHPWGENRLLGIGYETDPVNGSAEGIKLVMFDTTDPADLKIEHTLVIREAWGGVALDGDYHAVLADAGKNIIGFAVYAYNQTAAVRETGEILEDPNPGAARDSGQYSFFTYDPEKGFSWYVKASLISDEWGEETRGLYVGKTAYLVEKDRIRAYDMADSWKELITETPVDPE